MNNNQQPTESLDQILFTVDAEAFQRFCELLDAPPKDNPGLVDEISKWIAETNAGRYRLPRRQAQPVLAPPPGGVHACRGPLIADGSPEGKTVQETYIGGVA